VTEQGQLVYVGFHVMANGQTHSTFRKRLGVGDGKMAINRPDFNSSSDLSPRGKLRVYLEAILPAAMHGCELWVLSHDEAIELDHWYLSRLQTCLRHDHRSREERGAAGHISFAQTLNRAEALVGRILPLASTLWRRRRLGLMARMMRELAVAQKKKEQVPIHILAAYQWEVHPAGRKLRVPDADEVDHFLTVGRPGSWRRAVIHDLRRCSPPMGLTDMLSKEGFNAGVRTIPDSEHHVCRSGAALGPRPRERRGRRVPTPRAQLWESSRLAAGRRRAVVIAGELAVRAAAAAGAARAPRGMVARLRAVVGSVPVDAGEVTGRHVGAAAGGAVASLRAEVGDVPASGGMMTRRRAQMGATQVGVGVSGAHAACAVAPGGVEAVQGMAAAAMGAAAPRDQVKGRVQRCSHCSSLDHRRNTCPLAGCALCRKAGEWDSVWTSHMSSQCTTTHKKRKCTYCDLPGHQQRWPHQPIMCPRFLEMVREETGHYFRDLYGVLQPCTCDLSWHYRELVANVFPALGADGKAFRPKSVMCVRGCNGWEGRKGPGMEHIAVCPGRDLHEGQSARAPNSQ